MQNFPSQCISIILSLSFETDIYIKSIAFVANFNENDRKSENKESLVNRVLGKRVALEKSSTTTF